VAQQLNVLKPRQVGRGEIMNAKIKCLYTSTIILFFIFGGCSEPRKNDNLIIINTHKELASTYTTYNKKELIQKYGEPERILKFKDMPSQILEDYDLLYMDIWYNQYRLYSNINNKITDWEKDNKFLNEHVFLYHINEPLCYEISYVRFAVFWQKMLIEGALCFLEIDNKFLVIEPLERTNE
jgi:uncharacterized protein YutD